MENFIFYPVYFPFGLATAPMLFTRILGPFASFWYDKGINVCVNLDNGVVTAKTYYETFISSRFVKCTLKQGVL